MNTLSNELKRYLFETLGVKVHLNSWRGQERLPMFLTNAFSFQEGSILGRPCLFMFALEKNHYTPVNIRKYWEQVDSLYSGMTIYVQKNISSHDRKRLIEQKIPFIVPSKQMYIPEMGIELREHFQALHFEENQYLSPAAQTVVLYALLGKMGEKSTPSALAKPLGYTTMTISRAFDELATAEIGITHKVGKERWWQLSGSKKELWEKAKPKMRSPIKDRTWIDKKLRSAQPKIFAGLSALSHYSLLSPPGLQVFAIHKTMWTSWKKIGVEKSPFPHEALFDLQIWYYNPALFSEDNIVDPFSLYLSLEDTNDERVEIALEEMMRKIRW